MEKKEIANKDIFRRKRDKYYLRGEEREWNKLLLLLFFKIVATVFDSLL